MGDLGRELSRKFLHISMGAFALALAYLEPWQASLLAVVALVHNLFLLPLYGGRKLFRGAAARRGMDLGIVLYPASILVLTLIFPRHLEIVAAAWGYLAFGDGFATVAGKLAGRRGGPLPWNRDKSWAGLLAFAAAGAPGAALLYGWTAGIPASPRWVVPVIAVGVLLALVESLPLGLDDNLVIAVGGGALLYAALLIEPAILAQRAGLFESRLPWALGLNLALGFAALRLGSVDGSGWIHGVVLGTALWVLGGGPAFAMLLTFFVLGTVATRLGHKTKLAEGTAQEQGGARGARHAWANTGVGVLFALLAAGSATPSVYLLAIVAAFATAVSDTLASEIGQAYGRRTFLITSFRPVSRGTDGAVSLEGTLAGIGGSLIMGGLAWAIGLINGTGVAIVAVAAFFGTTLESYLGAWLERSKRIDNEAQNFINTLAGALAALVLAWLLATGSSRVGPRPDAVSGAGGQARQGMLSCRPAPRDSAGFRQGTVRIET